MKKKTIANLVMVAIIVVIAVAGVLTVGHFLGWFDKADETQAVLTDIRGVINLERDGVLFPVESDTVLRSGDQLTAGSGATAVIQFGSDRLILGSKAALTVTDPAADRFAAQISSGEIFVNTQKAASFTFDGKEVTVSDAVALISVRSGSQSVSVLAGSVADAGAGQYIDYVGDSVSVKTLQITSLNDFAITQIRNANKSAKLCFTDAQLDQLEADRNEAIQDIINSQLPSAPTAPPEPENTEPPAHVHNYVENVIAPTCTAHGYTEYVCACGDMYIDRTTPVIEHTWGDWITTKEPTSQQEGLQQRQCVSCGTKEEKTLATLPESHVHQYTAKPVAATCTTDGYTLYTCSCGSSYQADAVKATGHTYIDKVIAPTCTGSGYTEHTCACGSTYRDSVTEATGHNWTEWKVTKEPTSSAEGTRERNCRNCSAHEQQTIDKLADPPAGYVTLTIRCDTILDNMDSLNSAKAEFVPSNGVILSTVEVPFYDSETVFDVLKRVCALVGIQLEYSWQPMFETYYIEGINNLYEKDCGSESGWMFKVNDWFPNYGVSAYEVSDGDVIAFLYTCHGYGTDVGAPEWEG